MASTLPDLPTRARGLADFAGSTDLVLCDVWGVIHNGMAYHPPAVDALCRFRGGGGTVILVTNAPAPAGQVRARLNRLGVSPEAYDDIATSGDVTARMVVEAGRPPCFAFGPRDEVELFRQTGTSGAPPAERVGLAQAELALCIGLDDARPRPGDYDEDLRVLRERGLTMICANPDIVVQVGDELVYCAGAIAERYEAMGGSVVQAGKPFPPIYEHAFALARRCGREADPNRSLAIGDSMATDIQGAVNQGLRSIFVSTGIHHAAIHGGADGDQSTEMDSDRYERFVQDYAVRPTAVVGRLSWSGEADAIRPPRPSRTRRRSSTSA